MPLVLPDLVGTLRNAFRVARATFDASALTAPRTVTLPNKSGTLAMLDDASGPNARLLSLLDNAALAFNNNPRTRGVIAAGAPTITVGTATAPAGHTRLFTFGNAQAPFVSSGGRPTTASGRTTFPVVTPSATRLDFTWRVETIVDSDSVAFLLDSAPTDGYRFLVDGQYVATTMTTSAAGGSRYYRLQWPTKTRRRVTVEGTRGLGFSGAAVPDDGGCFLPHDPNALRMFIVGDSDLFLEGFQPKGDSYGACLGDFLGIRDTWCNGISNTAFVVNGGGNNYAARRADWTTLPTDSIDLLVLHISVNDAYVFTPVATVKAAMALELSQARAAHPNAIIVFSGCVGSIDPQYHTWIAQYEAAAQEVVTEASDALAVVIPVFSAGVESYRPLYGVPASGDTGTGNTPRYVSFAAQHMSPAGNQHYAEWLARRYIEAFAGMAGVPVPALAPPQSATAAGAGGSTDWIIATAGATLADDAPVLAVITTAQTFTLPTTIAAGQVFTVKNSPSSTAGVLVTVDPGAGRTIGYGDGLALPAGEDITLERGETLELLARSATLLEVQTPGAVGPTGAQGPDGPAGVAGTDGWNYVRLASDFTINTTASGNVTGLSFGVSTLASRRITVEGQLLLRTAATTTGPRPGIAWPGGLTDGSGYVDAPNSATAYSYAVRPAGTAVVSGATGLPNTTGSWLAHLSAYFLTGASPTGNFQVTLASEVASSNVTMRAGSYIRWREVP